MINITIEKLRTLTPAQIKGTIRSATRRAERATRAAMVKEAGARANIRARAVRDRIKTEIKDEGKEVEFKVDYRPIPLQKFRARQIRRGVAVRILKGSPRVTIDRAWISARGEVWRRKEGTRYPIHRLSGPSVGGIVRGEVWAQAAVRGREVLQERIISGVQRYWQRSQNRS